MDIPEQENTEIVTVSAYYADDEKLQGRLAQIEEELNIIEERIGKFRFGNTRFRTVSEVDWANEWKQYFHVTHVGESLVIKPSWEEYEAKERHVLRLIRMAFIWYSPYPICNASFGKSTKTTLF